MVGPSLFLLALTKWLSVCENRPTCPHGSYSASGYQRMWTSRRALVARLHCHRWLANENRWELRGQLFVFLETVDVVAAAAIVEESRYAARDFPFVATLGWPEPPAVSTASRHQMSAAVSNSGFEDWNLLGSAETGVVG